MGLFRKQKPEAEPTVSDEKIYYSTPFGDTTDGQQKPFLLHRDGRWFVPVFRGVESMRQFYQQQKRAGYMIIEGDVQQVLETNRSIELMRDVGVVIEPLSDHPVEITPT